MDESSGRVYDHLAQWDKLNSIIVYAARAVLLWEDFLDWSTARVEALTDGIKGIRIREHLSWRTSTLVWPGGWWGPPALFAQDTLRMNEYYSGFQPR